MQTFEDIDLFHLIGVICGLAIYNLTIVELHFPVALYKKLLKRSPTLDDLKELMPDVGRLDLKTRICHLLCTFNVFSSFFVKTLTFTYAVYPRNILEHFNCSSNNILPKDLGLSFVMAVFLTLQ